MRTLITGTNRGIGRTLVGVLQAQGHEVLGTARDQSQHIQLDVTDPAQHAAMARQLEGQTLDLLVCNAGVYLDKGHTLPDGFGAEVWANTFQANVTGVFLTIQALLPNLRLAPAPRIAIISSRMGSHTLAGGDAFVYRASKAAVTNLGRNLAQHLRPEGIAVGIYHPGWVRTDMGGATADVGLEASAEGLAARFATLSMETTGCYETFEGEALPF